MNRAEAHWQVAMESQTCPMMCFEVADVVVTGKDRLHGLPGEFRVVRCRACGLMRTDPRPTRSAIGIYYPNAYLPYHTRDRTGPLPSPESRPRLRDFVRGFLLPNNQEIPLLTPGRLLELGCADGVFLDRMAALGWSRMTVWASPMSGGER